MPAPYFCLASALCNPNGAGMARKALAKSNLLRFSDVEYDNRGKGDEAKELFAPTFKAFVFYWSPAFTSQVTGEPGILAKRPALKLAIPDALKAMDNLTILPLANFAARPRITPKKQKTHGCAGCGGCGKCNGSHCYNKA